MKSFSNEIFFIWLGFLCLWAVVYKSTGYKINQPFGIITFGLYLTLSRWIKWVYYKFKFKRIKLPKVEKLEVKQISDYNSAYQLKNTEIVLGMTDNKPVRINPLDKHTLIVALQVAENHH